MNLRSQRNEVILFSNIAVVDEKMSLHCIEYARVLNTVQAEFLLLIYICCFYLLLICLFSETLADGPVK